MGNINWVGDTFTEIHHPPAQITQRQYGFWTLVLIGVLSIIFGGAVIEVAHRVKDAVANKADEKTSKSNDNREIGPTLVPGRPTPDLKLGVRVSEHP